MSKHVVRRFVGAGLVGLSALSLAACGGKPSEGDIKDKLVDLYTGNQAQSAGITEDQAEKLAECLAPKMHENVSEDGLDTLMDLDEADFITDDVPDISKEDDDAMTKAFADCSNALG